MTYNVDFTASSMADARRMTLEATAPAPIISYIMAALDNIERRPITGEYVVNVYASGHLTNDGDAAEHSMCVLGVRRELVVHEDAPNA